MAVSDISALGRVFCQIEEALDARADARWILVPVVNVDGFEFGWDSDSFRTWRKTRSMHVENLEAFAACELVTPGQCEGCVGTDPNRNWVSDPPTRFLAAQSAARDPPRLPTTLR